MKSGHDAPTNVVCRDLAPSVRVHIYRRLWRNRLSFAGRAGQSIPNVLLPAHDVFARERHDREFP